MFRAHFGTNDSFYEPFETYALNNDSFVLWSRREMVAKYRPERSGRIVFLTGSSIIRCDSMELGPTGLPFGVEKFNQGVNSMFKTLTRAAVSAAVLAGVGLAAAPADAGNDRFMKVMSRGELVVGVKAD